MTALPVRQLEIFLAEDNSADVYLVELALREHSIPFRLRLATDGEEALRAVRRFDAGEPAPDIALLDLNLPRQEGYVVMRSIREHACCALTPIIVMSSVQRAQDKLLASTFQAVFFEKPSNLSGFLTLGHLVKQLCGRDGSAA